jgi:adenine deaminase
MDKFQPIQIEGNIIDVLNRRMFVGTLHVNEDGRIEAVDNNASSGNAGGDEISPELPYVMPGFVDSHIHVESSMLIPSQFARLAVPHGTVATISDPHEIANVCGMDGMDFMISNASNEKTCPLKIQFGVPSCVPATVFETNGATISSEDVRTLFSKYDLPYLAEMMNYPGVIHGDKECLEKIRIASEEFNKPVDGHSPGLKMSDDLKAYISAGISTDHECFTLQEALDKIQLGMKYILIREGSAAKNFNALHPLLGSHPQHCMFCSDDMHPDSLIHGHINRTVARALALGYDMWDVLTAACVHPVQHYNLQQKVGLLQPNDPADFIVLDDISSTGSWDVKQTYINGRLVAENGAATFDSPPPKNLINNFKRVTPVQASDLVVSVPSSDGEDTTIRVIEALDGELVTNDIVASVHPTRLSDTQHEYEIPCDVEHDLLKVVVVNRYDDPSTSSEARPPAVAFIKGFGLKHGAIASSVGHDSHNILAVGTNDADLIQAINSLISSKGGLSASLGEKDILHNLPLPVGGIMTHADAHDTAQAYEKIDKFVKDELKTSVGAPYMLLSFMSLLVIPSLKLSDMGLFDGHAFEFVDVFVK